MTYISTCIFPAFKRVLQLQSDRRKAYASCGSLGITGCAAQALQKSHLGFFWTDPYMPEYQKLLLFLSCALKAAKWPNMLGTRKEGGWGWGAGVKEGGEGIADKSSFEACMSAGYSWSPLDRTEMARVFCNPPFVFIAGQADFWKSNKPGASRYWQLHHTATALRSFPPFQMRQLQWHSSCHSEWMLLWLPGCRSRQHAGFLNPSTGQCTPEPADRYALACIMCFCRISVCGTRIHCVVSFKSDARAIFQIHFHD